MSIEVKLALAMDECRAQFHAAKQANESLSVHSGYLHACNMFFYYIEQAAISDNFEDNKAAHEAIILMGRVHRVHFYTQLYPEMGYIMRNYIQRQYEHPEIKALYG